MKLRNNPAPKNNAKASIVPIAAARSKALETDGSFNLSTLAWHTCLSIKFPSGTTLPSKPSDQSQL